MNKYVKNFLESEKFMIKELTIVSSHLKYLGIYFKLSDSLKKSLQKLTLEVRFQNLHTFKEELVYFVSSFDSKVNISINSHSYIYNTIYLIYHLSEVSHP